MSRVFEVEIQARDADNHEAVEHIEYVAQSETAREAVAEVREALEKQMGRSKVKVIDQTR